MPLTTTLRNYESEIMIGPDGVNGLTATSAAQCQHIRAVAASRIDAAIDNVGAMALSQIRDTLAVVLDL